MSRFPDFPGSLVPSWPVPGILWPGPSREIPVPWYVQAFFLGRFRKNSLKKNSPISKNSLILAETHGKKHPETEISANFSYLTMIPAKINLRKNDFSAVLLTITTWSLKNSLTKKKTHLFSPKTRQFLLKNSLKIPKTQFLTTFGSKPESKNAQKKPDI